jgi:hypothetical protein
LKRDREENEVLENSPAFDLGAAEARYKDYERAMSHVVQARHRRHLLTILVVGLMIGALVGYAVVAVTTPSVEE